MVNHQFGARLRQLRTERGLLQRDVEEALSLRPGAGSQYERGLREPGFSLLLALADYFDVSVDYLLGRPEAPRESPALSAGRRRVKELLRARALPGGGSREVLQAMVTLAAEAAPHHFAPVRLARVLGVTEGALRSGKAVTSGLVKQLAAYLDVDLTKLRTHHSISIEGQYIEG